LSKPENRKTTTLQIPLPKTKRDIVSFLGLTGYFRIWIPNYSIIAKPLYKAAKGDLGKPLLCPRALQTPFNLFKQALSRTPVLSITNPNKIIHLYQYSDKGQALGLVAQSIGGSVAPIAYLPKLLDPIYRGWPTCLKVLATAALLIQKPKK
jgi:hypothetical protein